MSFMEKLLDGVEVEWKAVSEVFHLKNGYTPSKSKKEYWEDGTVPWFRMDDIRENGQILDDSLQKVTESSVKGGKLLPANSIIISTSATIGEHALIKVPYLANQRFTNLSIKAAYSEILDCKFIFYYCFVLADWCKKNTTMSSFASVDMNGFKKIQIPIPCPDNPKKSLEIQAEIVRILDTFTELTTELSTELTDRKKQYNYYRDQLLSFEEGEVEWKTLENLTSLITKGTTPKSFESSGISFIKTEAFDGTRINKSKLSYVGETIHRTFLKRSILEEDDILFTIAGATIGKSAVVTSDLLPANTNQALAIIRLHQTVNKKYIFYILRSNHMKEYIDKCAKGSAQPNLNLRQINEFCIPLPSPEEQTRIVAILDKFDVLTSSITDGLPREIALRQQQYEYYRDLLLSFPKLESEVAA
jgi:type I restriction enzyme S subunit